MLKRLPPDYPWRGQSREEAFWRAKIGDRYLQPQKAGIRLFKAKRTPESDGQAVYERPAPLGRWRLGIMLIESLPTLMIGLGLTEEVCINAQGEYNLPFFRSRMIQLKNSLP